MENAIEVRNIEKTYPNFKLKKVSFNLPTGCVMGLVGKNGAGKSTIIRAILGGMKTEGGEISVLGHDVKEKDFYLIREDIGVVFDELCVSERFKVNQVNDFMNQMYKNWDSINFYKLIEQFEIPLKTKIKDMSKGTKMKLSIAIALSHKATLLILDEATSGLDPVIRDEILDIFNEFTRDEECSILMSSHIVSDLEKICDYIIFIDNGECLISEEKDVLLEKCGLLSCNEKMLEELDEDSILGTKNTPYGIKALVWCDSIPSSFKLEKVTLEDIFIYMTRNN